MSNVNSVTIMFYEESNMQNIDLSDDEEEGFADTAGYTGI